MKLTDAIVAGLELPAGKSEAFFWDSASPLAVRIRTGSKRYVVQWRIGAQQRRESIADPAKMRLETARKIARQRIAQVELGVDPAAEKEYAKAEQAKARLTVGTMVERYLTFREPELRRNTYTEAVRHLRRYWKPLHAMPLAAVKRADVAAGLQVIVAEHGRVSARNARQHLGAFYGWCIAEGLAELNPTIGTNDPAKGLKSRERVLTDAELRTIWQACGDDAFGAIVKLLILTGARRCEIGSLTWSEIDLETGVMTISGERTKTGAPLILGLPDMALEILRTVPRRPHTEHLFGNGAAGFNSWNLVTNQLRNRIAADGPQLPRWTLHDLRRTMRTGLGKLKVPPHIAELAIGHSKRGIEKTYDRYSYETEIRNALGRWAEHVAAIVEGRTSNVVPLQR